MDEEEPVFLAEQTDDWLADRRKELQADASRLKREGEAIKAEIDEIELEFNRRFAERNSTGTQTNRWTLSQQIDDHYAVIENREDYDRYRLASQKLYLSESRLARKSIREELDLLETEKQHWLEELEENGWDVETCTKCLEHITNRKMDEHALTPEEAAVMQQEHEHRLNVLRAVGNWRDATTNALNDFYRIPGVVMREKITLSQRKR
jgi:hypothetical protein